MRNNGALDSQTSPWVTAKALLSSDQRIIAENAETIYLPKLKAGEETRMDIPITINAQPGQAMRIQIAVDAGNHILEADENDNSGSSSEFTLSQGSCD